MTSRSQDMQASITELESQLEVAPPEMRELLQRAIEAARSADAMATAALAAAPPRVRPVLSTELGAFFTPAPAVQVPAWVRDGVTRSEADEALLRCPPEARVYSFEDSIGCSISVGPGRVPIRHGLQLAFLRSTGRLSHQRFYEHGLLRWGIDYHASGGREVVGFYADTERGVHLEDGLVTWFAPNGTVTCQSNWRSGVKEGWTRLWEDDGTPVVATRYETGREVEAIAADGTRLPVTRT
jgi:hypothetical protein